MSNAAHPGLSKTNLLSGASYGRDRPTLQARLTRLTWRLLPFMWLDVDEGIKPTLYAAVADVPGNSFAGPGGFMEQRGAPKLVGRSQAAKDPDVARRLWEVSEQLTGVSFPLRTAAAA